MFARILRNLKDNLDSILDWTEIAGSFVALLIFLLFHLFGLHDITIAIIVLFFFLGLLGVGRRLDHKINKATRQFAEESFQAIQTLGAQQTASQQMLQTLDTSMRDFGSSQLALQQSLQTLSGSVKSLTRNRFYPDQDKAYECLMEYINHNPVKEALFLQYSCKRSETVLFPLVSNKKAKAIVYIQHEEMAEQLKSERQVDRITSTIRNSLSDLSRKLPDPSNLTVYKFKTPASVRAIKIDDQVLCVGWYTYERVNRKGWLTYADDQTAISGHDRPTIVAWKGTEEYDVLDQMIMEMVANYQENAEKVPL